MQVSEAEQFRKRVRIYSKQDLDAHEALRKYRESIGLPPEIPKEPDPKFLEMGAWIDGLAPWDVFVTTTFRPIVRRSGNPLGFAHLETVLQKPSGITTFRAVSIAGISKQSLSTKLASISPSQLYVQGFFLRLIDSLERDLHCRISYFVGFEAGRLSGANHFHALLSLARSDGPFEFYRKGLWNWLFKKAGRSEVLPFIKDKGAGWYLTASYVGKKPLGWDVHVYGRTHKQRRPKRGGRAEPIAASVDMSRENFHKSLQRWHR